MNPGFALLGSDEAAAAARLMAPELGCCIEADQGDQLLLSEAFDAAGSYEAARGMAHQRLALLNGMIRFEYPALSRLELGPGVRRRDDGTREHFLQVSMDAVLSVTASSAVLRSNQDADVVQDPDLSAPKEPDWALLSRAAKKSPWFADALDMYGSLPDSPAELMKVVEALAAAMNGRPVKSCQILNRLIPGQLKRFEDSVNHPEVFGRRKARHGATPRKRPANPMTEGECRDYVRTLIVLVARKNT